MSKIRLDQYLLDHQFAGTLKEAGALIMSGKILVNTQKITTAGSLIKSSDSVEMKGKTKRFVSRGGEKLEAALTHFGLCPKHLVCLDVGISTGGFSDCLLKRGARHIIGIDVSYGLTDYSIRNHPKVTLIERQNARELSKTRLISAVGADQAELISEISLLVMDVSFISVLKIVPALQSVCAPKTLCVVLIKPQFEGKKSEIEDGGLVKNEEVRQAIFTRTASALTELGAQYLDRVDSAISGTKGNQECFFLFEL